jgi:hypothetical protein
MKLITLITNELNEKENNISRRIHEKNIKWYSLTHL